MSKKELRNENLQTAVAMQTAEPSQLLIQVLEEAVLPRLQSGEETSLLVAEKEAQVVSLPAWPGALSQKSSSPPPLIHKSNSAQERWRKDPLLGFIYVIRGEAELLLSRRVVTCHAGNFVFFLPHTWSDRGTTARWKRDGSARADCDFLWLYLRPQEVLGHMSWLRGVEHIGSRHLFIPDNRVLALAELLHEEISFDNISPAAPQLLWLIFDRVRRRLREGFFSVNRLPLQEIPGVSGMDENIGQRAQKYIDANLMERMTLESVARAVFTSRARLAREFRQHTGETFGAYLLRCRIERAQSLLTSTSCSIKEIAWRSGFSDPDYFCAVFRRAVGSTPTAFRKKIR